MEARFASSYFFSWMAGLLAAWITSPVGMAEQEDRPELILQPAETNLISRLQFSPNGCLWICSLRSSGAVDGNVAVWSLSDCTFKSVFPVYGDVNVLDFSPDGKNAAVCAISPHRRPSFTVWLCDSDSGDTKQTYHDYKPVMLQFSPRGECFALANPDNVQIRSQQAIKPSVALEQSSKIDHLAFSPGGELLVGGSGDGKLIAWEPTTGRVKWTNAVAPHLHQLTFSPKGNLLASLCAWQVSILDSRDGRIVSRPKDRLGFSICSLLEFSPDGRFLVAGTGDKKGTVKFWDVEDGSLQRSYLGNGACTLLAISPDGHTILGGIGDGFGCTDLKTWDTETGESTSSISFPRASRRGVPVAISPFGHRSRVAEIRAECCSGVFKRGNCLLRYRF